MLSVDIDDKYIKLASQNPHSIHGLCDDTTINEYNPDDANVYVYKPDNNKEVLETNINQPERMIRTKPYETVFDLEEDASKDMIDVVYVQTGERPKTTFHSGQLKLFMSTLQFLTKYSRSNTHVVYPGAAPGTNIAHLAKYFPKITWHLYDPRKFDPKLKNINNIIMTNDFFLPEHIEELKSNNYNSMLLISDIRVCDDMSEENIDRDMKLQATWVKELRPDYSQLKFRLPRLDDSYEYFSGIPYLQMFAPVSSTETRLVVSKKNIDILYDYDLDAYEGLMYYYNRRGRCRVINKMQPSKYFDGCMDCSLFRKTVDDYNKKFKGKLTYEGVISQIVHVKKKLHDHNLRIGGGFTNI